MPESTLSLTEGVLLAHALVARLAADAGARILFIKGPTAVAVGARPDRPSTDVDVLVDPASFGTLCQVIETCGWQLRVPAGAGRPASDLAFEHSAHYIHPEWPCDVDVHYLFPGFLAPPTDVFDALWERRTEVSVAGRVTPTIDLLGQALVVGLHALRDPDKPRSVQDLDHLESALAELSEQARHELIGLAQETGAPDTARPMLQRVGADPGSHTPSPQLHAWMLRQRYSEAAGSLWLEDFSRASWWQRPRVLIRAAAPRREVLLSSHLVGGATRNDMVLMHLRRWRRGVATLPRSVSIVRELRRSFRG